MGTTVPPRVSDGVLQDALRGAVRRVWRERPDLISQKVNERTVVAHIACALGALAAGWPGRWCVDVEYNRWHRQGWEQFESKFLEGWNPDGSDQRVFPDLIVHDPRGDGPGWNLLVLEAKKGVVYAADRESDYRKLEGFLTLFDYQLAVFLEFDGEGGPPRLQWLSAGDLSPDPRLPAADVVQL